MGTHWEVDPDAGQALLGAVTLTLVRRAGLSKSKVLPDAGCSPRRCQRWPRAQRGTAGHCGVTRAAVPGCSAPEGQWQLRLGRHGAWPLSGLRACRPLSTQRPGRREAGPCLRLCAQGLAH